MDLKISDLRMILNHFDFDFNHFLSDSEVENFHDSCESHVILLLSHGVEVTSDMVNFQDRFYDELDLYIRFLQELSKFRPLPF